MPTCSLGDTRTVLGGEHLLDEGMLSCPLVDTEMRPGSPSGKSLLCGLGGEVPRSSRSRTAGCRPGDWVRTPVISAPQSRGLGLSLAARTPSGAPRGRPAFSAAPPLPAGFLSSPWEVLAPSTRRTLQRCRSPCLQVRGVLENRSGGGFGGWMPPCLAAAGTPLLMGCSAPLRPRHKVHRGDFCWW